MNVTVQEIKDYLRVEHEEEDNLISIFKVAATNWCEEYLNRPISEEKMTEQTQWEVPDAIRLAIYMLTAHWYENRGVTTINGDLAFSVKSLLSMYRRKSFGGDSFESWPI